MLRFEELISFDSTDATAGVDGFELDSLESTFGLLEAVFEDGKLFLTLLLDVIASPGLIVPGIASASDCNGGTNDDAVPVLIILSTV